MNIMLVTVTERTAEIGLKKAIGAKRRRILAQFLTEASVLTGIGGLLGVLGGIGMSQLISKFMDTPTALSVPAILVAVVFSVLIGLIFLIWLAGKGYNTVVNILCRVQHLKEVHFDSIVIRLVQGTIIFC